MAVPGSAVPRDLAVVARRTAAWRGCCDVVTPSREPYKGDPGACLRRTLERAEQMGFSNFYVGPELSLLFRSASPPTASRRSSTRATCSTSPRSTPARTSAARRCWRSRSSESTWSTPTRQDGRPIQRRDRHAFHQRPEDGRQLHDVPHHGQGYAMKYGWHAASCPSRCWRTGWECTPTSRCSRNSPQPLLRRERPVLPVRRGQGLHRGPAQARARDHVVAVFAQSVTPTSASSRAMRRRSLALVRRNRSALMRVPLYHPGGPPHGAALPRSASTPT